MIARLTALSILAAVVTGLPGCAPTSDTASPTGAGSASAARRCFYGRDVDNFRSSTGDALYVRTRRDGVYRIETFGDCFDLQGAEAIGLTGFGGAPDRLCPNETVRILIPGAGHGAGVCSGRILEALTAEQVAALSARDRP